MQAQKTCNDLVTAKDIEAYVEYSKRDQAMDDEERGQLVQLIGRLKPEQQIGIVTIVQDGQAIDKGEQEFTFDLQNLTARKQRELEAYIKKCIFGTPLRNKKATKQSQIRQLNTIGGGTSSAEKASKGVKGGPKSTNSANSNSHKLGAQ